MRCEGLGRKAEIQRAGGWEFHVGVSSRRLFPCELDYRSRRSPELPHAGNMRTSTIAICALSSSSPYVNGATDTKNMGADAVTLSSAVAGVAP